MSKLATRVLVPFGVEVDFDLRVALTRDIGEQLRLLFAEHRLLLFRGQSLTRAQQESLVRLFGPISPPEQDVPLVTNRGDAAALGDTELSFHSDMAYAPDPYIAISLLALNVEPGQTATRFVDGVTTLNRMPQRLRRRIDGVRIRNVYALNYAQRDAGKPLDPRLPQGVFPLVRTHPVSGKQFVYISQVDTREVVDVPPSESEALLADVFDFAYATDNVLEHHWYNGDLIIWDNLALQHARSATGSAERTLQRVSCIRRTLSEQFPQFPRGWLDVAEMFYADHYFKSELADAGHRDATRS